MRKFIKSDFNYYPLIEAVISSRKIIPKSLEGVKDFHLKSDDSFLTKTDLEINQHLILALKKYYPAVAIISEENSLQDNVEAILQDEVFIIDPLDGTSSFVRGNSEFSVNVALKIKNKLVVGLIYSPIEDVLYYAENGLLFKWKNASGPDKEISQIFAKNRNCKSITVIATRREDELQEIKQNLSHVRTNLNFISFSSSLKFCYLAEGSADVYYRAAKIKLWDVAAGFAIANAAGFEVLDHQKNDLLEKILSKSYTKSLQENQFRIEPFIVKRPDFNLF